MTEVIAKVDEVIELIDSDPRVIRIKELKRAMNADADTQKLIHDFQELKARYDQDMIITKELIDAKTRLYDNHIVAEYRELYSHLNLIFIKFNKDIKALLHSKNHSCNNIY
jgi:cell fate (sporulation/competence/biofilm development) regulator YlbF (YheA/YmcA/DUF963 family)